MIRGAGSPRVKVVLLGLALAVIAGHRAWTEGAAAGGQSGETQEKELLGRWESFRRNGSTAGSPIGSVVGAETCGACHADVAVEQEAHPMARTGTALLPGGAETWFPEERLNTAVLWRSAGPDASGRPRYRAAGEGIALAAPWGKSVPVHAVFGSGLRGITPVAFDESGGMRELRVSWSHGLGAWIETPGSEEDRDPLGDLDSPQQMRECVGCHATATAWIGSAPDLVETEWGVRCERCHGPGEAHAGTTNEHLIFNPGRLAPAEQARFCGQCHRTPTDFEPLQVLRQDLALTRHAGGSLMMSACFRASPPERTITCTDCHDPHRAEPSVAGRSRSVCQRCHEDPAALHDYEPVTAASDCLACHMPRREEVFPGAAFTDHRIRVPGAPPAPGSDAERTEIGYLELLYRNELATESDPREEARLLIGLGELLFAQGLGSTAVETLHRGLEADPDYERLLKAGALLRASGQLESAEAAFARAAVMAPEAGQAFFDLGDLRLAAGDAAGAVSALERARPLDADSPVVASRLGAAYRETGRNEDALREGLAAVTLDEASPGAWLELGLTRWRRRELNQADEALRTAHALDSDAPAILDPLARLLALDPDQDVRDLAEARRLAERLAGFGGYQEPASLDLLAAVYAAAGDFPLAVRTAELAVEKAREARNEELAVGIAERLAHYRAGRVWRSREPG